MSSSGDVRTYRGWREVPWQLMTATALEELEFPRTAADQPVAGWVETVDWRGKFDTLPLYDARICPPTKGTARALDAAAARSRRPARRVCDDCGAHCQRPLRPMGDDDPRQLCPACRHITLLRAEQTKVAVRRVEVAGRVAELLGWADAAIVQGEVHTPPPTPAGAKRKPTAARVWAVGLDGRGLVDVTVRLVGPRAKFIPDGAVAPEQGQAVIYEALLGRRLIAWGSDDLAALRLAAPHPTWPGQSYNARTVQFLQEAKLATQMTQQRLPDQVRGALLWYSAAVWRGQLDPHTRDLVPCVPPGTPDRLLLLLRRIAATATATTATATTADEGKGDQGE